MKCQFISTKKKCGKPAHWKNQLGITYCDIHKKELEKVGMKFQKALGR